MDREDQGPFLVVLHRAQEVIGDEQREIELPKPPILALGADELAHVRVRNVEGAHLRPAATTGGGDGEAHLVVDVHERQRPRGVSPGTGDESPARPERGELIADAATGFEREPGLVHLAQDVVHRVMDRPRDGAVDRGGVELVLARTGIGHDPSCRDGPLSERPKEALVPIPALRLGRLDLGQRTRHPLPGGIDVLIDRLALEGAQAVLLVPDVPGGGLKRDQRHLAAPGGDSAGMLMTADTLA